MNNRAIDAYRAVADYARAEKVAKQPGRGKMTPRERVELLTGGKG